MFYYRNLQFINLALITFTFLFFQLNIYICASKNTRLLGETSSLIKLDSEIPFLFTQDHLLIINVSVGFPMQSFDFLIDTASYASWILDYRVKSNVDVNKTFNSGLSLSFKNNSLEINDLPFSYGDISGYSGLERVYLANNISAENFNLSFINRMEIPDNKALNFIGVLGLGNYNNVNYQSDLSIIEALYRQKQINRRVFSLKYLNETNGILTIGKIPDDIENYLESNKLESDKGENVDINKYGKCKVSKIKKLSQKDLGLNHWSCLIKGLSVKGFDSKSLRNETRIFINNKVIGLFDTSASGILIPISLFEGLFLNNFFIKEIESKKCFFNYNTIGCLEEADLSSFPSLIYFRFENFFITIKKEDLFQHMELNVIKYKIFLISFDSRYNNIFLLGTSFLKSFTTVFDWESQEIGLYGKNVFLEETYLYTSNNKTNINKYFKVMMILAIAITLIDIFIILLYFIWLQKKNIKRRNLI